MRLFGRRNQRVWRRRVKAHALIPVACRTTITVAGVAVGCDSQRLPPRGAALRLARIGGKRLAATVMPAELYWRSKAPRHARHKPKASSWVDWRISQGFQGGRWVVSQLRKLPKPSKAGRP